MKKLKSILLILLVMVTMFPPYINAETKKPEANKEPVNVYIFHGSTCGYCKVAFEWFETIEKEYGDYFNLVDYEVWGNSENQSLMEEVAALKGDAASGVPYILAFSIILCLFFSLYPGFITINSKSNLTLPCF